MGIDKFFCLVFRLFVNSRGNNQKAKIAAQITEL